MDLGSLAAGWLLNYRRDLGSLAAGWLLNISTEGTRIHWRKAGYWTYLQKEPGFTGGRLIIELQEEPRFTEGRLIIEHIYRRHLGSLEASWLMNVSTGGTRVLWRQADYWTTGGTRVHWRQAYYWTYLQEGPGLTGGRLIIEDNRRDQGYTHYKPPHMHNI